MERRFNFYRKFHFRNPAGLDYYLIIVFKNDANTDLGKNTGVSDDGRESGRSLDKGYAPFTGMNRSGVTALLISQVKLSPDLVTGMVQNLKIGRSTVRNYPEKVKGLLNGYFGNGGTQLMLTVADKMEPEKAICNPEAFSIYLSVLEGSAPGLLTYGRKYKRKSFREPKIEMRGIIVDILRRALDDGPGIRTIFFIKRCFLKCLWFHNPESKAFGIHVKLPAEVSVRERKKIGEKYNVHVNGMNEIEREDITLSSSFHKAYKLYGSIMEADNIIRVEIRDRHFYELTGGGLTVSGGEPLNRISFLHELQLLAQKEDCRPVWIPAAKWQKAI